MHIQPEKIILFGSYANGNPTEDSDLDLLTPDEVKEWEDTQAAFVTQVIKEGTVLYG